MNVVILGCGRTGATLALMLTSAGHSVTLIEESPESLRRLGSTYPCKVVLGNGLDPDVLEKAGIKRCDAFFAVTRGDNTNIMAAQIVRKYFHIDRVAVKVADPQRAAAYQKMGLFCINSAALLAGMCRDWLTGDAFLPIDQYNVLQQEGTP